MVLPFQYRLRLRVEPDAPVIVLAEHHQPLEAFDTPVVPKVDARPPAASSS